MAEARGASPYQTAAVHVALGEHATALELLGSAAERRDPWIVVLAVDPSLRPLRGEPAFVELVRRVHGTA